MLTSLEFKYLDNVQPLKATFNLFYVIHLWSQVLKNGFKTELPSETFSCHYEEEMRQTSVVLAKRTAVNKPHLIGNQKQLDNARAGLTG